MYRTSTYSTSVHVRVPWTKNIIVFTIYSTCMYVHARWRKNQATSRLKNSIIYRHLTTRLLLVPKEQLNGQTISISRLLLGGHFLLSKPHSCILYSYSNSLHPKLNCDGRYQSKYSLFYTSRFLSVSPALGFHWQFARGLPLQKDALPQAIVRKQFTYLLQ